MTLSSIKSKVGVYVDVANINMNGGYGMQYDVLREFACRGSADAVRLNAYVSFDRDRAREDDNYSQGTNRFYSVLREFGYKVIQKNVKWFVDEAGNRFGKANADLDMAVDALMQSKNLDRVLLVTGDGDFVQVVRALQNYGCRVEAIAFEHVSSALQREVDLFVSGYLIPNLLPPAPNNRWGQAGHFARGYCYHFDSDKGFGFMRFMAEIAPGLWITDSRDPQSPYDSAFFHVSNFTHKFDTDLLPSRHHVFEFKLSQSDEKRGLSATYIKLVS
jgi:uncharacterized LabA/DUF88 family protein